MAERTIFEAIYKGTAEEVRDLEQKIAILNQHTTYELQGPISVQVDYSGNKLCVHVLPDENIEGEIGVESTNSSFPISMNFRSAKKNYCVKIGDVDYRIFLTPEKC